ncbi:MAG: hypothetical protein WCD37_06410, partial [Chloroflexia bacterium]
MAHDTLVEKPQFDAPVKAQARPRTTREMLRVLLLPMVGAIVAFLVALLIGFLSPRAVVVEDVDLRRAPNDVLYDPLDFTYGLRPLQQSPDGTTYNLTGGQAFFTYPYMANLGRHVHVSARLAADPAGGQPISGTLVVNGAPATRFRASGDFTLVQATLDTRKIPNPYLDPAHVQIEIRSETRPDAEGNEVGVAIDWIRLESERSRG